MRRSELEKFKQPALDSVLTALQEEKDGRVGMRILEGLGFFTSTKPADKRAAKKLVEAAGATTTTGRTRRKKGC